MFPNTKRICLPDFTLGLGLFISICIASSSCNTRIEGCLEANAENFDFNAERPCDGCCTYPSLGLTLTQKWGDRNFSNTDTLVDALGNPYKIEDLRYFLTTWSWKDENGDLFTVDSVEADCGESTLKYTPDNVIIDTRKFVYTLGTTRDNPTANTVQGIFGLGMDFSCLDPEDPDVPSDLTDESPLYNPASSKLETLRLIIRKDLESETLDTFFMDIGSAISLADTVEFKRGFDTQFLLTVDYALWFQDANVNEPESFEMSIATHFNESIFPTP